MSNLIINPYIAFGGGGGGSGEQPGQGFRATKATGVSESPISGYTVDFDDTGSLDESTGVYTAVGDHYLWAFGKGYMGTDGAANSFCTLGLYYNSTTLLAESSHFDDNMTHNSSAAVNSVVSLSASDTVDLRQAGGPRDEVDFSGFVFDSDCVFSGYVETPTDSDPIVYPYTEQVDLGGDLDATTGVFTVPTTGTYLVGAASRVSTANDVGYVLAIQLNGTTNILNATESDMGGNFSQGMSLFGPRELTAGDELTVRLSPTSGVANGLDVSFFGCRMLGGNYLRCGANGSSGVSGDTITAWNTPLYDTESAFNNTTGVYTVPATGKYVVAGQGYINAGSGTQEGIAIEVDGVEVYRARSYRQSTSYLGPTQFNVVLDLTLNEEVTFVQYGAASEFHSISIIRVDDWSSP